MVTGVNLDIVGTRVMVTTVRSLTTLKEYTRETVSITKDWVEYLPYIK